MEVVLLAVLVVFIVMTLALSPLSRRNGETSEAETRATGRSRILARRKR